MKNAVIFILVLGFSASCSSVSETQLDESQSAKDGASLLKESHRVEKLNQIDQALVMAATSYEKFTLSDYLSGKSAAAWQMARLHLLKGNSESAIGWKNNSNRLLSESGKNSGSVKTVRVAEWFWLTNKPDSVLHHTVLTDDLADEDQLQLLTWRILSADKIGKYNQSEMEKLETKVNLAFEQFKDQESANPLLVSTAAYSIAHVYYGQNNFQKAKTYYQTAYEIDQLLENPVGLAADLRGLSFSSRKLNQMSEAKGFLYRCIEIYRVIGMTKEADDLTEKYKVWF